MSIDDLSIKALPRQKSQNAFEFVFLFGKFPIIVNPEKTVIKIPSFPAKKLAPMRLPGTTKIENRWKLLNTFSNELFNLSRKRTVLNALANEFLIKI